MIFQALVRHHQTGAITVQQLQTIRAFGAKHKYRAREWVLIQFVFDPCGKYKFSNPMNCRFASRFNVTPPMTSSTGFKQVVAGLCHPKQRFLKMQLPNQGSPMRLALPARATLTDDWA